MFSSSSSSFLFSITIIIQSLSGVQTALPYDERVFWFNNKYCYYYYHFASDDAPAAVLFYCHCIACFKRRNYHVPLKLLYVLLLSCVITESRLKFCTEFQLDDGTATSLLNINAQKYAIRKQIFNLKILRKKYKAISDVKRYSDSHQNNKHSWWISEYVSYLSVALI